MSGIVDKILAGQGRSRRVVVAVPYFLAALATVAGSALIATVPRRIALCHAAGYGLAAMEPPMPIRRFPVGMAWNRRAGGDPAVVWLREALARAAAALGPAAIADEAARS